MIDNLYKIYTESTGISTDTRNIKTGNLFFALKGPNFNGNKFIKQAKENGATFCIIDEEAYLEDNCILVENALQTLQDLANFHIKKLNIPVIGITGSNGKTTTKELTFAVLSQKYKTFCTQGNLNNHIGVPLTILCIKPEIEIAIIELGANHIGEIELLCKIAEPTHGLITNIGLDHLEGYGSIEGVAKGNSELFYHLLSNNGWAFVNSEDEMLMGMAQRLPNKFTYPAENDDLSVNIKGNSLFLEIEVSDLEVTTQLTGKYNIYNIGAALAIGTFFKVPIQNAMEAIAAYQPSNMRSQIIKKDNCTIILDAYNANPSSMEVALQNLSDIDSSHKIAILGDMFEMGNLASSEHERIATLASQLSINQIVLIGNDFSSTQIVNEKIIKFKSKELAQNWISNQLFNQSIILLKGSRGMAIEKLIDYIQ